MLLKQAMLIHNIMQRWKNLSFLGTWVQGSKCSAKITIHTGKNI
jgi:hypothetical protein